MALQWYDEKADNSPWIKALAELRQRATREGYCYQHVQAITVAIDQYAEKGAGQPRLLSQQAIRRRLTTRNRPTAIAKGRWRNLPPLCRDSGSASAGAITPLVEQGDGGGYRPIARYAQRP